MSDAYADTDEHRWLTARVARGEATAQQMLDRMRWAQHPPEERCEIDYLRAELKHWRRLYGRQSATIGGLRDTVGRLRSERDAWRESDQATAAELAEYQLRVARAMGEF